MLANTRARSPFAADDTKKARELNAETLDLETFEEDGLKCLHLAGGRDTPRPRVAFATARFMAEPTLAPVTRSTLAIDDGADGLGP